MSFQLKTMLMVPGFANCSLQVTWQPVTQCLYLTPAVTPGFIRQLQTHFCTQWKIFPYFLPLLPPTRSSQSRAMPEPFFEVWLHFPAFTGGEGGSAPGAGQHQGSSEVTLGSCQEWTLPGAAPENPTGRLYKQGIFVRYFLVLFQNSLSPGSCYEPGSSHTLVHFKLSCFFSPLCFYLFVFNWVISSLCLTKLCLDESCSFWPFRSLGSHVLVFFVWVKKKS